MSILWVVILILGCISAFRVGLILRLEDRLYDNARKSCQETIANGGDWVPYINPFPGVLGFFFQFFSLHKWTYKQFYGVRKI